MIIHDDKKRELTMIPIVSTVNDLNYNISMDEIETFVKYAESSRAYIDRIIIYAPRNLSAIPKILRTFMTRTRFELVNYTIGFRWEKEFD